ncbi:hypothetical protein F4774DRAFT_421612 [Daldinia eschscholtzii]|nr:hypothetical protein F4774DRAFT_421612 [Daldinia eschscholtzii]
MNFTRNDLLDTNWETRATISRVVEKLQCLRQRCLEDPTYTVAIPRPRKPPWPPQKLASLYQDNSSTLKSQTQPTSLNMDQLTSSNGPNLPDSITMPHQDGYWPNFDGQHYGISNDSEMFNFSQNNVMSMEGVSGSHQFGALSHRRIHAKRQIPPEQNVHGSPKSRRRTSDNMTGYRKTIDEPKKKKARKKGGTATRSPSKDKSPKISEQDPFQAPSCEVAESSGPTAEGRMFACPFYKQNPEKYNTKAWKACAVPEGRTIPRLKSVLTFSTVNKFYEVSVTDRIT